MKKFNYFMMILCLSCFVLNANASDWQETNYDNKTIFVDKSSIKSVDSNGNVYQYWTKYTNNGYEYKIFGYCDCVNGQTLTDQANRYKDGQFVGNLVMDKEWKAVVPDSFQEAAYNYVCDLRQKMLDEKAEQERRANEKNATEKILDKYDDAASKFGKAANSTRNIIHNAGNVGSSINFYKLHLRRGGI